MDANLVSYLYLCIHCNFELHSKDLDTAKRIITRHFKEAHPNQEIDLDIHKTTIKTIETMNEHKNVRQKQ